MARDFGRTTSLTARLGARRSCATVRQRETTDEPGFFGNPEDSREPNDDGIVLDFADQKVMRESYSRG